MTLPKYMLVKNSIIGMIQSGELVSGNQIPTETELREVYNVSRQTVRQAVTQLVYEGVLSREQGRGTYVTSHGLSEMAEKSSMPQFKKQSARNIVAVLTTTLSDYIFPLIIEGIEKTLSDHGYSILLMSTGNSFKEEARALTMAINKKVDGLIVDPTLSLHQNPNIGLYHELMEMNKPIVTLHSSVLPVGATCVRINDGDAQMQLVQHVIDFGHRFIGGIFLEGYMQSNDRLNGFLKAIRFNGLRFHAQWVKQYEWYNRAQTIEEYATAFAASTPSQRPTAVVCYNDQVAIPFIKELRLRDIRIPEDISVVGFDDLTFVDDVGLGLTTVSHPKQELGKCAAETILNMIESIKNGGKYEVPDVELPTPLVIRTSVVHPPLPLIDGQEHKDNVCDVATTI